MDTARDLALALDPARWAEAVAGFELDPWQRDVLRSDTDRLLMNCARQTGKSTVAALLALHRVLYRPGTLALLLSPSLRQSSELFRKAADFYQRLDAPVLTIRESALRMELGNGSRVISLPGKEQTVRGFSGVDLLVIDEASRVSDDLYFAVRPMLAVSGGRLLALSTPWGQRGWWFGEWAGGGDAWERVRITALDCPRITEAFLEEERRAMGRWWYEQEYLCEFRETAGRVFSHDALERAFSGGVDVWNL
jgi:hypothetical protein